MPNRKNTASSSITGQQVDTSKPIFVFGSNLAGIHGAGAAAYAVKHYGARYGEGIGRTGHSYALPTKDEEIRTLPIERIKEYVEGFINHAKVNPEDAFFVTRVGCGLAGYKDEEIAPLFKEASDNCLFDSVWKPFFPDLDSSRFIVVQL
jgi:hypothetical protein